MSKENCGWIKLDREVMESWIWDNDDPYDKRSAFVDLLLRVNHEEKDFLFNGVLTKVKKGEILTSVRGLAKRWNWSVCRVYRFLDMLEKTKTIERKSNNEYTVIKILDYEQSQLVKRGSKQYGAGYHNGSKDKEIEMLREKIKELEGE